MSGQHSLHCLALPCISSVAFRALISLPLAAVLHSVHQTPHRCCRDRSPLPFALSLSSLYFAPQHLAVCLSLSVNPHHPPPPAPLFQLMIHAGFWLLRSQLADLCELPQVRAVDHTVRQPRRPTADRRRHRHATDDRWWPGRSRPDFAGATAAGGQRDDGDTSVRSDHHSADL